MSINKPFIRSNENKRKQHIIDDNEKPSYKTLAEGTYLSTEPL